MVAVLEFGAERFSCRSGSVFPVVQSIAKVSIALARRTRAGCANGRGSLYPLCVLPCSVMCSAVIVRGCRVGTGGGVS